MTVTENASVGTRVGQVIATDTDFSRDVALDGLFREAASPGSFTNYTTGQTIWQLDRPKRRCGSDWYSVAELTAGWA